MHSSAVALPTQPSSTNRGEWRRHSRPHEDSTLLSIFSSALGCLPKSSPRFNCQGGVMYQQADRLRHNFLTVSGVQGTLRRLTFFSLRRNAVPLSSTSSERADFVDNLVPCPSKCLATRISVRSPSFLARTKKGLLRGALQGLHLPVPSIVRCVSCIVLADLQLYVGKLKSIDSHAFVTYTTSLPPERSPGQTIHVNRTWTVHINTIWIFPVPRFQSL